MKTVEQILAAVKSEELEAAWPDGRNLARLCDFLPVDSWPALGFALGDGAQAPAAPEPFTQEAVQARLKDDLSFAFEKALNKRGISSAAMYTVVKTWLWVLDDPLNGFQDYAEYGLPLFKAVALKYGWPNPIGEDSGSEHKYSTDGDQ